MNDIDAPTVCSGETVPATNFTRLSSVPVTIPAMTFYWDAIDNYYDDVGVSSDHGTGNMLAFTATNNTAAPITTAIRVTPQIGRCIARTTSTSTDTKTRTITVNPKPVLDSTAKSICSGTAVNYTGTSATAGTTFTWSRALPPDISSSLGTTASGTGTITEILTNTTSSSINVTYAVTLTGPAPTNCDSTQNVTVTVKPAPAAPAAVHKTVCFNGGIHTADATPPSNCSIVWYTAASGGNGSPTAPGWSAAGIYTAYAATKNSTNCESAIRTPVTVTVTQPVTLGALSYNGGNPICTGGTAVSPTWDNNPTATGTYTVSPSGLTIDQGTGIITPSGSAVGNYTVTYTVPAAGGCQEVTATAGITVAAVPTVGAPAVPAAICAGSKLSMTAPTVTNNNGSAPLSGSWQLGNAAGDGSPFSDINLSIYNFTSADNGKKLRYRATNGCGSGYSSTVTVTVKPLATAGMIAVTGTTAICSGNAVSLSTGLTNTGSVANPLFTWYDAPSAGNVLGTDAGYSPAPPPAATVIYYVSVRGDNYCENEAGDRTPVTVTVTQPVTLGALSYNSGNPICTGGTAVSPSWNTTPAATGTYSASSAGLTIDSGTGVITPSTSTAGNYTVTYAVAATGGCSAVTATAGITVAAVPTVGAITTPGAICAGSKLSMTAPNVTNNNGSAPLSGSWQLGDAAGDESSFYDVDLSSRTFTTADNNNTLRYRATNGCGNGYSNAVTVTVNPKPTASIGSSSDICLTGTNTLTGTPSGGGGTSIWKSLTPATATVDGNGKVTGISAGAAGIRYIHTDANGCTDSTEVTFTVNALPTVTALTASPMTVCVGEPVTLTATGADATGYILSDGVTSWTSTGTETVSPAVTTTYTVTAQSVAGCVSANSMTVTVTVNTAVTGGKIGSDQSICADNQPTDLTNVDSPSGGNGTYTYVWESSTDGTTFTTAATPNDGETYTFSGNLAQTTYYRRTVSGSNCGTAYSDTVKITVNPKPDYPDIRMEVCAGSSSINLSKYLDTVGSPAFSWTGLSIDASGVIASIPSHGGTYTYTYSVTGACLNAPVIRKLYLHAVKNNKVFFPHDTIAVCYEQAEALQMNQIFGVEATGAWSTNPNLMNSAYIHQSTAPSIHAGAVVFNGKAAYEANPSPLTQITYRGKPAKAIEFSYTVDTGCLKGVYKTVIVLYEM